MLFKLGLVNISFMIDFNRYFMEGKKSFNIREGLVIGLWYNGLKIVI